MIVLEAVITCPRCGHAKSETMPTNACQFFYACSAHMAPFHAHPFRHAQTEIATEDRASSRGAEDTRTVMTSFSLTRPKIPLAAALSQMLENIETELAEQKLEAADERRLRQRAKLIRWLLTPSQIT